MVIKNFLTGICVLLAFGATESFGAASIRATTVGASGSTSGGASARTGSMRLSGTKTVSATPATESGGTASSSATGARMPVLPGGTPKLGTSPKLPSMTGGVSLDGYATEAWTIENFQPIGDYQPAGDYLTESDLNGYATEGYVDSAIAGLAPHILIQAGTNNVIYYCIAAGCEDVPVGTEGYWAEFPTDGLTGADGREVELRNNGTYIQWRYKTGSDTAWKNLVKLSDLQGPQGNSPTVVVTEGESGTYTMTVTNADGTTQTVSWTGGGSDVGGGISLDDVATAGYLNDLSGSTYVDADTNGNTGTIALKNITSSRDDINSASTKLTRAMDVQSYVVNYVASHGGGGGSSTIVYSGLVNNVSDLPTSGLANGATYYVVNEGAFYIYNSETAGNWDIIPFTADIISAVNDRQPKSTQLSFGKDGGEWSKVISGTYVTAANATDGGEQGTKIDIKSDQLATTSSGITSGSEKLVQAKAVYAYAQPKGNYQAKATANYHVSKSDGTWQALDSSVSSGSLNGVTSKGIYDWGIAKSDPSYAGHNNNILQIKNIAEEGETPNYVATWQSLPEGMGTGDIATYLSEHGYPTNFGNYQPAATADYRVSKSDGTWRALDSSVSSGSLNGVTSNGIYDWGTGTFLAKSGHNDHSGDSVIVDSNGNLYFGNVAPNIQLKFYNNALWYCTSATPCADTDTPSAPNWASVNISGLNGKTPIFRIDACGSKAATSQCIQWAYEGESNWTDLISLDDIVTGSLTGSRYVEITAPDSTGKRQLTIPQAALILKTTTASSNPEDEDLVTLGGMRCVTSKTTWHGPTPVLTGTNTGCKGTRPSSWANYKCYTEAGYTQLQLQNTCLATAWGDGHNIPDECGETKNNGSFSYTICQGYQEANSGTETTYIQTKYLLEKPICVTAYDYTQPLSPVSITQATSDEGETDWNHLMSNTNFASAVNNSIYSSVGFYTVIGKNKTGQKCGDETTTWSSELDDGCNQIMQSSKYNYYICTVGTTGSMVNNNTTYLYREPIGIIPKPECEQTTIDYTGPNTTIGGSGAPGSKTNPYTVRGFITMTIENTCDSTAKQGPNYFADHCEYVEQEFSTASGNVKATGDLMQCTQGDDNETTYYLKAKGGMCGLMLVSESYAAPTGNNGTYGSSIIYSNKGVKNGVYLNPCDNTVKNSAVKDSDCQLVDIGELKTNGVTSDNDVIYSCTCGGKPDSASNTPCDSYTASNPQSYYWKGLTKAVVKQCEVTTTDYVAPGIQQEGNSNLNNNCGTGSYPDCTVRGYSKITTKHNCSSDTDTVDYAIDTCVVAKTQYSKDNRAASPWYDTTSATMTTRYLCTKNNGNKDTYFLESSGSGMCGKILVDIGYKEPGSCTNAGVCGTKGKKVKTYLDPCATGVQPGYAQVEHEEDEDICTLSAMEEVAYEEVTRSGNVVVPRSRFRSECTCGGAAATNGNVCYGHTLSDPKTYYWDNTVNVCAYKMVIDDTADVKQYVLKQNCDGTQTDVGGVCTPTVEYEKPENKIESDSNYNAQTAPGYSVCNSSAAECYATPGKTITTPYTDDASGKCVAGTSTSVEDTCEVNAELSYSKSNTNNYTYYDCTNGELSYTLRKGGTTPYFKGLKQDVASKVNASDIYGNGGTSSQPASGSIAANAELARTAIQPGTGFNTAANTWLSNNAVISFKNGNDMDQKATEVNLADFVVAMSQLANNVSGFCNNCTTEGQACYAICHVPAQPVVDDQH